MLVLTPGNSLRFRALSSSRVLSSFDAAEAGGVYYLRYVGLEDRSLFYESLGRNFDAGTKKEK